MYTVYFAAPDWLLPYFVGWILFSISLKYGYEIYHANLNCTSEYFIIGYIF